MNKINYNGRQNATRSKYVLVTRFWRRKHLSFHFLASSLMKTARLQFLSAMKRQLWNYHYQFNLKFFAHNELQSKTTFLINHIRNHLILNFIRIRCELWKLPGKSEFYWKPIHDCTPAELDVEEVNKTLRLFLACSAHPPFSGWIFFIPMNVQKNIPPQTRMIWSLSSKMHQTQP